MNEAERGDKGDPLGRRRPLLIGISSCTMGANVPVRGPAGTPSYTDRIVAAEAEEDLVAGARSPGASPLRWLERKPMPKPEPNQRVGGTAERSWLPT
jgi:hypothetical protein